MQTDIQIEGKDSFFRKVLINYVIGEKLSSPIAFLYLIYLIHGKHQGVQYGVYLKNRRKCKNILLGVIVVLYTEEK